MNSAASSSSEAAMRALWLTTAFIVVTSISADNTLLQMSHQNYVMALIRQLNATQRQLDITQRQLNTTQQEGNVVHQRLDVTQRQLDNSLQELHVVNKQLNASHQRLHESQHELRDTRNHFNSLVKALNSSQMYEASLSDQVKQNTKEIKALNPNCNLQPTTVCGVCECRDDDRLDNRYYCDCLSLPPRRDCLAHLQNGGRVDGVYRINPNGQLLNVFCDQQDSGGGWTVIQRRKDGSVNFYRNWNDYARGFGSLHHEFWLGNDHIFLISLQALYPKGSQMQVDMEDFKGERRFARYENFQVGNAYTNYQLNLDSYSGDAGDGLKQNNNMMFSTFDKKNNGVCPGSCAAGYGGWKGAWWYNCCGVSNLNGEKYYFAENSKHCEGIFWSSFTSTCGGRTLKYTLMKMRRK